MRHLLVSLAFVCGAAAQGQSVVTILPADGATSVPLNARIILTAGYGSYFLAPFKVTKGGTAVSGSTQEGDVSFGLAPPPGTGGWFMFTPDKPLDPQTAYQVEFDSPSYPPFFASFTTGTAADNTPLQLVSSNPSNGQDGVNSTGSMTLHFNKPVNPYSFQQSQFSILDLTSGQAATDYYFGPQAQPDGSTLVFNFNSDGSTIGLLLGQAFQFQFPSSGITDWLGNPLSPVPAGIEFTTFQTVEKTGPVVVGTTPADGATGVAINSSIVLVFDKPLAQIAWDSAVALNSGGTLKFKLDNTLAGGRALVIQPALLLPPNSQVTVKVTGLMDAYGAPMTAPIDIAFRTGTTAETRQLLMNTPPSAPLARNDAIQATFNRAIDPLLLSLGGVKVYPAPASNPDFIAVPSQLSADRLTVKLNPSSPLPPGSYSAYISVPFDRTAGKLQPFTMNFTLDGDTDTTPPQVLALTPPDGTTDAPVTSLIQVTFSEPVIAANASATPFQLLENGSPVAGVFTLNGSQGSFIPKAALDPSATYRISITGLTDLAGNPLAAFSASFTTSAANSSATQFQVTGIVPASNAVAAPSTAIVLTFNREIDPVSLYLPYTQFALRSPPGNYSSSVPGQLQAHGAVLTFTPSSPLAAGSYGLSVSGITDLAGNATPSPSFYSAFTIAGRPLDSTPPSVISVSPGDGQPVLYLSPYVVFTFSKPINPGTLSGSNIAAFGPNGYIAVRPAILAGDTQVAVTFSADPGTLVTLVVTPGVADLAGNPALPFRTTVLMSQRPVSAGAAVVSQRPGYPLPSNNVPPNTGLTLLFNAPVDRASVEQGLLVTVNGAFVPGRVDWSPDSMGLTFVASAPYPYSATVDAAIVYPAKDAAGNDVSFSSTGYGEELTIAAAPPAPPASLAVIASNFMSSSGSMPLDAVIELQFNQDVSASLGVGSLTDDSTGPTRNQVISCSATLIRTNVIRFTPQTLLQPNDLYSFNFASGSGLKWSNYLSTGTAVAAPSSPYVAAAGPVDGSVALNAQVTVAFSSALAEFLMPGGLTLQTGGATVPTRYAWSAGDRALTLTPLALLHANTDYTVSMTGFEDLAGHSIPDRNWTFHTASGIDLQAPAISLMEPAGDGVSANAVVAVTFSKPVAADWIGRFTVVESGTITLYSCCGGAAVAGNVRFSDDQRTAFFTPAQPLLAGHYYSINVPLADDFSGNVPPGAWYSTTTSSFRVGFSAPSAPTVLMATPDDGSSGLPLNAQFQAQFDQPVLASSLDGVALFENGAPLPATASLGADGRTVTALPQRPPAPLSTVVFRVAGVTNTSGLAMAGAYRATLNMGQAVDTSLPSFLSSPANGQTEVPLNAKLHLRFNKPLNKLTVNARNIVLTRSPYNTVVDAAVSLQDGGRTVVIAPTVALTSDMPYVLQLNGVSDLSGNTLGNSYLGYDVSFSTSSGAPATPPVLLAFDPPDGSQNLPANPNIQIVYSQPVDLTLGDNSVQLFALNLRSPSMPRLAQTVEVARSGYGLVSGTVGVSNGQITFTPAGPLADGVYRVQTSGIADVSGNPIDPISSTFTVEATASAVNPRLVSSTPAAGAVGVPVSAVVTLNFNETVSTVSAAQLQFRWQGGTIPGSFQIQGSVVTFTPAGLLPGAASISVAGYVKDLWGRQTYVSLAFTTGANSDPAPPTLVFAYPAEGALVPAYGTNVVLQFSKPVTAASGATPIQILAGSSPISGYGLQLGEDGRTFAGNLNLAPDTDITVGVTSALVDFASNPIKPVSIHFRTASDAASRGPQVLSVSPANGAVNVNANSPIVLQFSHAMEPVSVGVGLQVTDAGPTITGSTSDDSTAQVFTFRPDVAYKPGTTVGIFAGSSIFDATGERTAAFYSQFGTAASQGSSGQAVSVSASANAIDVRFSGRIPAGASQVYLRRGMTLVPAEVVDMGVDQIRVIPAGPLDPSARYYLVLDATEELAIQVEKEADDAPCEVAIVRVPGAIRLQFSRPINPLTALRGGVKLLGPDGASVDFTTQTSVDRTEMLLTPATLAGPLTVVIDGVESRAGRRLEPQTRRP